MKKFITRIFVSFVILLGVFGINYSLNSYFIKNQKINLDASVLLMGESHIKSGLNPKFIKNSINIAQSGETYFITYHKLKSIVEQSEAKYSDVVLSMSHNNFIGTGDSKFYLEETAHKFLERTYAILPFSLLSKVKLNKTAYIKTMIRKMLLYPKKVHKAHIGEGHKSRNANLESDNLDVRINRYFYIGDHEIPYSINSELYLDSIIDYTIDNQIELTLVNTPHHPKFYKRIPPIIDSVYQARVDVVKSKGINYLDLHELKLEDSDYANYDHLSKFGAKTFSKEISNILTNN